MMMKLGTALLVLYAVVVLAAWLGQRRLMYVPDATRVAPASLGLEGVSERQIGTADGNKLIVWRAQARSGQPTLLYFHGNAGNLASRAERAGRYVARGVGLMLMSYRGYGGSTGQPSEASNLADARLAYDTLIAEGIAPADIVLYGESLGSGVAVQLATEKAAAVVVLDAPYTSMVDMALRNYPFLPVRPLLSDRYESARHILRVKVPLIILHGARDRVVPTYMGQALHELANPPKRLVIFPDGGHTDLDAHGAIDAVLGFVAEARARKL